jgi:hypothetical protein
MTSFVMPQASKDTVLLWLKAYSQSEPYSLVIMPDGWTDVWVAKLLPERELNQVSTQYLGDLLPGVSVHAFGIQSNWEQLWLEFRVWKRGHVAVSSMGLDSAESEFVFQVIPHWQSNPGYSLVSP